MRLKATEARAPRSALLLGSLLLLLPGCRSASGPFSMGSGQPDSYSYREVFGRELSVWVFRPDKPASSRSGILLFHGGGWNTGDPEWTFAAARRFASRGMVAISVEYRLSRESLTPIDALADVCASFRWVREHSAELGVTAGRIAGYGVSAGGHLAASAATVGCSEEGDASVSSTPNLLLLWSPALDVERDGWFVRLLQNQGSATEYSPVVHVRSTTPPTSIVIGTEDTLTPIRGSLRFCELLREQNVPCEVNAYEGVGHLLTRNLANQESDFDPDPEAVANGVERHLRFLADQGFIDD